MSYAKNIRELLGKLESRAIRVLELDRTGKGHYKLRIQRNGKTAIMICGGEMGDRRVLRNILAQAERLLSQQEVR